MVLVSLESLFDGILGFGWCSDYETRIRTYRDGTAVLTHCGAGFEELFEPSDYSAERVTAMVDEIMAAYRKVLTWRHEQFFVEQARALRADERMRRRRADELKLWAPPASNAAFRSRQGAAWNLAVEGGRYVLNGPGGAEQRFTLDGRIVSSASRNGVRTTFAYSGDVLRTVSTEGASFEFTFGQNGKISSIKASDGQGASYEYDDNGLLVRVVNGWGYAFTYEYNTFANLTRIGYPDGTDKTLSYDDQRDWVVEFKERDGCREKYVYTIGRDDATTATVTKTCKDVNVTRSQYDFFYTATAVGARYLSRVKATIDGKVTDVTYHPVLGKPHVIIRGGAREEYTYDANGFVTTKQSPASTKSYEYDYRCQLASHVAVESKHETWYRYDDRCNLVLARDSAGNRISIRHDEARGRATATDQSGQTAVLVRYPQGALVLAAQTEQQNRAAAARIIEILERGAPVRETAAELGWLR